MAIAASRPLDMPRQQAFWLLHLAGWSAHSPSRTKRLRLAHWSARISRQRERSLRNMASIWRAKAASLTVALIS